MVHIATIRNGFSTKFGIPRQSGLVDSVSSRIVFTPEYRNPDALRSLEEFSHIWLIWEFSESVRPDGQWSPTVRPPRLGGNTRVGVFATRSPFRPNPIGLSCVRLDSIEYSTDEGPVLHISGADLMNGTPIFDIKPYIPLTDCRPDATEGFTGQTKLQSLEVTIPSECLSLLPPELVEQVKAILSEDPRPHYHHDPSRIYGLTYDGYEIRFTADSRTLYVRSIQSVTDATRPGSPMSGNTVSSNMNQKTVLKCSN